MAQLARIAGVSRPSITVACQKRLAPAVIGGRVDLDHPEVVRYLAGKDGASTRAAQAVLSTPSAPPAPRPAPAVASRPPPLGPASKPDSALEGAAQDGAQGIAPDVSKLMDKTLRQILTRYGTMSGFNDMLAACKKIADISEKNLRIAERAGMLIPREFVQKHVFAHIDGAYRKLLTDAARTIASQVYSDAKAGIPLEAAEQRVHDLISKQLSEAKAASVRALREYQPVNDEQAA